MKNAFHRKTKESVTKRINIDLIDKKDIQLVKNGKSKKTVVDRSADSEK